MNRLVRTWLITSTGLLAMFAIGEWIVWPRSWPYYLFDVLAAILGGWAASFGRQAFLRGFNSNDGEQASQQGHERHPQRREPHKDHAGDPD